MCVRQIRTYLSPASLLLCAIILLSWILVACTGTSNAPAEKVIVQFNDQHGFDFAGFYTAQQKGFYSAAGLAVEFATALPATADTVSDVSEGRAQFAVSTTEEVIRGYAAGADILAVASIYRETPLAIMTLKSSEITRPDQLVEKMVSVASLAGGTPSRDVLFLALLKGQGIRTSELRFTSIQDPYGAAELVSGRAAARSAISLTKESVEAELSSQPCNYMYFGEYGVRTYTHLIVTSASLAHERPDLVRHFVQATMQGYQYTIEHPEEAVQLSLQIDPALDPQVGLVAIRASIPLIDTGKDVLGWMEEAVWMTSQDILVNAVLLSSPVDLSKVYTNDYLLGQE